MTTQASICVCIHTKIDIDIDIDIDMEPSFLGESSEREVRHLHPPLPLPQEQLAERSAAAREAEDAAAASAATVQSLREQLAAVIAEAEAAAEARDSSAVAASALRSCGPGPEAQNPKNLLRLPGRRAKTGLFFFGSLAFAMKNRHFGGECSWILAGKARKCGRFWVLECVPNPGKQSIWRQCPPSARKQSTKKLPNRPGFTHAQRLPLGSKLMPVSSHQCPLIAVSGCYFLL